MFSWRVADPVRRERRANSKGRPGRDPVVRVAELRVVDIRACLALPLLHAGHLRRAGLCQPPCFLVPVPARRAELSTADRGLAIVARGRADTRARPRERPRSPRLAEVRGWWRRAGAVVGGEARTSLRSGPSRRARGQAAAQAAFPARSSGLSRSRSSLSTVAALCSWSRDPYTNVAGPASTRLPSRSSPSGRSRSSSR